MGWCFTVLVACSAPPEPELEPTPWEPPSAEKAPASVASVASSDEAVDVDLAFSGVGNLYRGYFAHPEAVATLGKALGACLDDTARLVITYDDEERIGRIVLDTDPRALSCRAVGPQASDLRPLSTATRALAIYRDTIASSRDFRVASFRIGLTLRNGVRLCTTWAGGQFPPDGSTFSRCATLAGVEVCMPKEPEKDHDPGVAVFSFTGSEDQAYWAACNAP